MAVLYPVHALGDGLETALLRQRVPYRRFGREKLMSRKATLDAMAYLRLVVNPRDTQALNRIYNEPKRKVGAAGWIELRPWAADRGHDSINSFLFHDIMDHAVPGAVLDELLSCADFGGARTEDVAATVKARMEALSAAGALAPPLPSAAALGLPRAHRAALQHFRDLFVCVRSEAARGSPHSAADALLTLSGYKADYLRKLEPLERNVLAWFEDVVAGVAGEEGSDTVRGAWDSLPPPSGSEGGSGVAQSQGLAALQDLVTRLAFLETDRSEEGASAAQPANTARPSGAAECVPDVRE